MDTNLSCYKERVKRLRNAVTSVLNIECSQSQAYELLAKEENYPNWDALSGTLNKKIEVENLQLTKKEQITQLFFLNEGVKNGCPFSSIIKLLKEQNNPILVKGWSNVQIPSDYNKFWEIFEQTGFFSDEVLTILKISSSYGNIESGMHSAIEFLKID
jgi:hypothetical protein